MLGKLIEHVGLEDSAELVALASAEQLASIFDEQLWQSSAPGEDERFDAEHFLLWLRVLLEAGERFTAERLSELPQDLLTLALHRHLLVLEEGALRRELSAGDDDAEASEKALADCLSEELDEFQLIWRGGDGWDDVLAALLALDRDHHSLVVDLLERSAQLSQELIEDNGSLYDVLTSEEMLESDLGAAREARRSEQGYVAPSAAAAFLRLARQGPFTGRPGERDALTRAYFRDLPRDPVARAAPAPATSSQPLDLAAWLESAGVTERAAPRALLAGAGAARQVPLLIEALRCLAEQAPASFGERHEELAYLSNVLLAGCSVDGNRLRPVQAVEHAIAAVNLGLWLVCGSDGGSPPAAAEALQAWTCDGLLRLAFAKALEPGPRLKPKSAENARNQVRALLKAMKV